MNADDLVVVAKFGRPQGLDGSVRVFSFTQPKDNVFNYQPWYIRHKNNIQAIETFEQVHTQKYDLVKVRGYKSREDAAKLTNAEILVAKQELPDLASDEYYWHDLIGMTVITSTGSTLGTVSDLLATGANDVLIIEGDKRHLVPFLLDQYVLNIDQELRSITVAWDEDF